MFRDTERTPQNKPERTLDLDEQQSWIGRKYLEEGLYPKATRVVGNIDPLSFGDQKKYDEIRRFAQSGGYKYSRSKVSFSFELARFKDGAFFAEVAEYLRDPEEMTEFDWSAMKKLLKRQKLQSSQYVVRMERKGFRIKNELYYLSLDNVRYEGGSELSALAENRGDIFDGNEWDRGMATVMLASMVLARMKQLRAYDSVNDLKDDLRTAGLRQRLGVLQVAARFVSDRRFIDQLTDRGLLEVKDTELFLRVLAGWGMDLTAEIQRLPVSGNKGGLVDPVPALGAMMPREEEEGYWPHGLYLLPMLEMTAAYYLLLPDLVGRGASISASEISYNWSRLGDSIKAYFQGPYFREPFHEELGSTGVRLHEEVVIPWLHFLKYNQSLLDRREEWGRVDASLLTMVEVIDEIRAWGGKGSKRAFYYPFGKHGPLK